MLANPAILGEDLMVLSSEYDGFESSEGTPVYDRLDVLALDKSGRLVVAELKRDRAQSAVTMQALNYAAMMSRFSLDDVCEVFVRYQRTVGREVEEPLAELQEWAPGVSDETLGPPSVILVASDFAPQVTNTAMFLFENRIDIRLIQVRLYRTAGGELVLTRSQLLPVPAAENFMMKPRSTATTLAATRENRVRRASITQRLVASGYFQEGAPLRLIVPKGVDQDRAAIDAWLDEDPVRRGLTWQQDTRKPVVWDYDGTPRSFADLTGVIIDLATQQPPRGELWGANWILDQNGTPLNKLADMLDSTESG
ncbi:hypothetical protein D1871_23300 [Nakamurella silvestris]|nr:hypothetical protein D1871_23300 [Nakamurella silvestris]